MTEWLQLQSAWHRASAAGERALLFTVVDVIGSSYRKIGAHMLATESGTICGAVSAGCIEADLITRLPEFFSADLPQVLSYTNIKEDEFSLNRGCNGDICILVEPCPAALESFAIAQKTRATQVRMITKERTFVEKILPPIRLYVFGSQRDSAPLQQFAEKVDMEVVAIPKSHVDSLATIVSDARSAAVIMSHDYERDRDALAELLPKRLPYLGIMGPKYRTEQMLTELKTEAGTLRYPVGLNLRAEGAQEIAVSIVGEIISTFRSTPRIATVILAAGAASRFGSPKQLARVNGVSFVRRMALECLAIPDSSQTAVVLGSYADQVAEELSDLPVQLIINGQWSNGIGTSVAAAASWARSNRFDGLLIATCDQIRLTSLDLQQILHARQQSSAEIVAASYGASYGIPSYFASSVFAHLCELSGDVGAKALIAARAALYVPIDAASVDVDYADQLATCKLAI